MFTMFPLLFISGAIYAIATLVAGGGWVNLTLVSMPMSSGDRWEILWGDFFLIVSLVFLFVEILRATRTGSDSLWNHALSAVTCFVAFLLFVVVPGFGNSVFFLFALMTALDFVAGFIVTSIASRRDFGVTGGALG